MNREQVFLLIRAHLVDELEVEPGAVQESTRFRQDLEADSLDLYTLVQELEDSYGVRISDEEASRILTVGQAVDFVLASGAQSDGLNGVRSGDGAPRAVPGLEPRPATASQGTDPE
jgi:acyl carrier protein